uniref:C3H1-type domain-containing protein n=1 Tax=Oryza punctata TaxID=4537 RepID=A0A0E0LMP9_ORYPU
MVAFFLDEEGICALGELREKVGSWEGFVWYLVQSEWVWLNSGRRNQEMDMNECLVLLNRAREFEPSRANGGYSSYPQIRQYASIPDEQLRSLPSLLPPSPGQELPLAYLRAQFQSSGSYHGIQAQRRPPIDQTGALQSPFPEFICLKEQLQSLSISGDGVTRNSLNAVPNFVGYPHSSSKSSSRPCRFHFFRGYCKKGVNCQFFHGSVPEVHNARQVHHPFASLSKLDMEIRELLIGIPPPVAVDRLPSMYFEKYGKPLRPDRESQQHGRTGCSLTSLLMGLNTITVVEREHGQYYVVLVEDARKKYMDCLGLAQSCNLMDTGTGSNQIYMTFPVHSKFTDDDVQNYFKQFGPVSGVRIPYQEKRMFGFVSFLYTETVRLILSKGTAHFICGSRVLVKRYMEKPELRKISRKNKQFDYREHRTSGFSVTNEHYIGNNMKKISHKSDDLDEASAYEDSDEIILPDSLGLY